MSGGCGRGPPIPGGADSEASPLEASGQGEGSGAGPGPRRAACVCAGFGRGAKGGPGGAELGGTCLDRLRTAFRPVLRR